MKLVHVWLSDISIVRQKHMEITVKTDVHVKISTKPVMWITAIVSNVMMDYWTELVKYLQPPRTT